MKGVFRKRGRGGWLSMERVPVTQPETPRPGSTGHRQTRGRWSEAEMSQMFESRQRFLGCLTKVEPVWLQWVLIPFLRRRGQL